MGHAERQVWPETAAAVADPHSKGNGGAVATLGSNPAPDALAGIASHWERLYRTVAPVRHADFLALANQQQDLLAGYSLPVGASHMLPATEENRAGALLEKMLAGQHGMIEPVRSTSIQVIDETLDVAQRHAVAAALATPDVCLIQGFPGTGKSRVVVEILVQAAKAGKRVLLLAAQFADLDRILERVAQHECVSPLRCVGPEEQVGQLPATIRALTLQERAAAIRQKTLGAARETRQAAELQCARRRHESSLWSQLEQLPRSLAEARGGLAVAETKLAAVEADVARDARASSGRVAEHTRSIQRAGREQLALLATEVGAVENARAQDGAQLAELERQIAVIEPLAAAKQNGRWWSPKWWQATFQGKVVSRLNLLHTQRQQSQEAALAKELRLQELANAQQLAQEKTTADLQACIDAEIAARQRKMLINLNQCKDAIQRQETLWNDLCRQIDSENLRPSAQTPEAVRDAQDQWQARKVEDESRCEFARAWADFMENSSGSLDAKLPGFANLVAATPQALAADLHFGESAPTNGHRFDLLVVVQAHQLAEGDILKGARRVHQVVLVGEHSLLPMVPHAHGSDLKSRSGVAVHRLWHCLHSDPSLLPHAWFREGQRLGCRLRNVAFQQRRYLESEPLADAADVELRILALPGARPVLAEVLFANAMTVPTAKEFLAREMQHIAVQTSGRGLLVEETPESIMVHFTQTPDDAQMVPLDSGLREYLGGQHFDLTCKLEFDRSAGWDRPAVEQWIEQNLHLRDLGRTVWLDRQHRMAPALADVVADLFGMDGGGNQAAGAVAAQPAVEFISVLASAKAKPGAGRNGSRGPRNGEPTAANRLPAIGAGLEIDLAALRQGDRVPEELRTLVPGRGFVNITEARAVVRKLEELFRQSKPANCAVIALYASQAELIRRLIHQTPSLAAHTSSIAIGPPAAFRCKEADVVLVSLTRSHSHRAVAYGEGPAALELAMTRARRLLVLIGDPGNLSRRSQWRGVLDHLDEQAGNREAWLFGQLLRYLQGRGNCQSAFRLSDSATT